MLVDTNEINSEIKILKVEIRPSCGLTTDIKPDGTIENFKEYELTVSIKGSWNNYISSIKMLPFNETKDGVFYYGKKDGFVSYGYDSYHKGTGHGSLWSSNPGAIKSQLGKDVLDVAIIPDEGWRMAGSITLELVKSLVPEGYILEKQNNGIYKIRKS